MTPCGWGVKAGVVRMWVAGKTGPCAFRPHRRLERGYQKRKKAYQCFRTLSTYVRRPELEHYMFRAVNVTNSAICEAVRQCRRTCLRQCSSLSVDPLSSSSNEQLTRVASASAVGLGWYVITPGLNADPLCRITR